MTARTVRMLHVEDDPAQQLIVAHHLKRLSEFRFAVTCAPSEEQAVSDAQLREAIKRLTVVQKQLAGAGNDRAAQAAVAIGKAIKELNVALEIR